MFARRHFLVNLLLCGVITLTLVPLAQAQREPLRPEIRGIVKAVDAKAGTITVATVEGRDAAASEKTFSVSKDVEVAVGASAARVGLFQEGKLADLTAGVRVSLMLTADLKSVDSILAEGPTVRGQIKSIDAKAKTLTLAVLSGREPEEKTYTLAADPEVAIDDGRGRRFSIREGQLADLAPGAWVTVWLSVDAKQVQGLMGEAPTMYGTVKAVDAGKRSITVQMMPGRGAEAGEERTLTIANNAAVMADDGGGRRLSVKETKLENVPTGAAVLMRLSMDQNVVMSLRAEGPSLTGMLKAVDPVKNTIVLAVPRARGEEPEQKNLTVAKNARVNIDGQDAPLANLKVGENGPFVQVRLSLDQSSVQFIMARTQPR